MQVIFEVNNLVLDYAHSLHWISEEVLHRVGHFAQADVSGRNQFRPDC